MNLVFKQDIMSDLHFVKTSKKKVKQRYQMESVNNMIADNMGSNWPTYRKFKTAVRSLCMVSTEITGAPN